MLINFGVKFWTASKGRRYVGKLAVTYSMLLLWFATFALAVSPQLHRLLHHDAQNLNHECLITQIKQQSFAAGCVASLAPVPPLVRIDFVCCDCPQFVPALDYRSSFVRGPPSISASKVL
jgi:hypothetical protein